MKILFCLALLIVTVCSERVKRQTWRNGLWGRELEPKDLRKNDMAAVFNPFREGQSNTEYKNDIADSETRPDDRLNFKKEVQDPWIPFQQVIGKKQTSQRKRSQEE